MSHAVRQRIDRVRREYNQWVADETLEDYALRFTAKRARKWSLLRVANTAFGAVSFLALEAIGGTITLQYGFTNAAAAILAVGLIILLTGLPIGYFAAKYGVDIDLLTRGAGFGYIGSTITSLIYASFTFIFFAIEAVIMSNALESCFGVPLSIGYLISALVVIPVVAHGITLISRLQLWSQPLWLVLHLLPFVFIAVKNPQALDQWTAFAGPADSPGFDLLLFGACGSVVLSLIAQIGEQVDFLRFLPAAPTRRWAWWGALLAAGPGWIVFGTLKLLAGSFLAVLALHAALPVDQAARPTVMYRLAFGYVSASPLLALWLSGLFVIVSQLKINVTNSYAGSIAWSNFFSRLTHDHPGRVVWLVFNVGIALLLIEFGVYAILERILGLYSTVAAAWVGALVADLVINKPLGLSPPYIEFKRAHLYDVNPVGTGAMTAALALAAASYAGGFGEIGRAFFPFVALAGAFVIAPAIALLTKGRFYLARRPRRLWARAESIQCCICNNPFEPEDMAHCPAYAGPICSLCCSLDARCNDSCKPEARFSAQLSALARRCLPAIALSRLNVRLLRFLGLFVLLSGVTGLALCAIYFQTTLEPDIPRVILRQALWKIYFLLLIIGGILAWLLVLMRESRHAAQEESVRQTNLLMREIAAHQRTDRMLLKAKEAAEAANQAKTRFVVAISHELRSPLNAILGYAQLLDRDGSIPDHRRDAVRVIRRSGEHLAGLIEGLLDISKIEAGRLHLYRDEVRIGEFLDQMVDMFRLQAEAKGISFRFDSPDRLPAVVRTDQKRLRQILINLLSNAVKFTDQGQVTLTVRYRSQVAEFSIADTGIGIRDEDAERIFEPFERGHHHATTAGLGLGLTITKLLTEIMGGRISMTSRLGQGSDFRVKLLLAEVVTPLLAAPAAKPIRGYLGRRRTVLVIDDDRVHCGLLQEVLPRLGFTVVVAHDGPEALYMARQAAPDLVLLDISLPTMNGWEVAARLRRGGLDSAAIIMVSANANEAPATAGPTDAHDDFIVKPIDLDRLIATIGHRLQLRWTHDQPHEAPPSADPGGAPPAIPAHHLSELRRLGRIGYVRGIKAKLDEIGREDAAYEPFVGRLRGLIGAFDLTRYMAVLARPETSSATTPARRGTDG